MLDLRCGAQLAFPQAMQSESTTEAEGGSPPQPASSSPCDTISKEEVAHVVDTLRTRGFVNYFGLQRFGGVRHRNYVVGAHIMAGQWRQAVDAIVEDVLFPEVQQAYKEGRFQVWGLYGSTSKLPHTWLGLLGRPAAYCADSCWGASAHLWACCCRSPAGHCCMPQLRQPPWRRLQCTLLPSFAFHKPMRPSCQPQPTPA